MKRRSFLQGLAGLFVLPVAARSAEPAGEQLSREASGSAEAVGKISSGAEYARAAELGRQIPCETVARGSVVGQTDSPISELCVRVDEGGRVSGFGSVRIGVGDARDVRRALVWDSKDLWLNGKRLT